MTALRSALFMLLLSVTTVLIVTALLCVFWLPTRQRRLFVMPWIHFVMWLIRHLLGIETRIEGKETFQPYPA